jgi:hypothetical protein
MLLKSRAIWTVVLNQKKSCRFVEKTPGPSQLYQLFVVPRSSSSQLKVPVEMMREEDDPGDSS